ncbi:MAG: tetratricopeptide repeat protein [Verrucomicrobiales bacterium]|nr:tetratricopeptide repeat protein [Verrucomicrobiales bacterium]
MKFPPYPLLALLSLWANPLQGEPLFPTSDLWKSPEFQKVITGSYGIDSRIEPLITTDEEEYLRDGAGLLAEGERTGAIELYENASILPQSPAMMFSLASLKFEEGEFEAAKKFFNSALESFPNFRDAHRNLAMTLIQLDEMEEAEASLIRAVELGARDGVTLGLLGYCHASDEDFQAALQSYRQAQITMPGEIEWKLGEARCLRELGQTEEAIGLYRELLKMRPTDAPLWLNLAFSLQQSGDDQSAIQALEVARTFDDLNASSLLSLGHLYLGQSLPGEALTAYESSLNSDPPISPGEATEALRYLVEYEHFEEAKTLNELIEATFPDTVDTKRVRLSALIEFETGDPDKAITTIREAVRVDPLDGESLLVLGRFLATSEKSVEAEMIFEQAALLQDHAADAYFRLGELLVERGEYAKAVEKLVQAQSIEPRPNLETYLEAVRKLAN